MRSSLSQFCAARRLSLSCATALVVLWALGAAPARAQPISGYPDNIRGFDPREVAMLPKYCMYTQDFREHVPGGNDAARIEQWTSLMGEMFVHMHHYCYGLMKMNRALYLVRDLTSSKYYLRDAINEFDYVIGHASRDFLLYPELLNRKAEALIRLGQAPNAIELLEQAIEIKPDYWAPYATMADYFRETGNLAKARELLQSGIASAPDAKGLQRRLRELDAEETKRRGQRATKSSKQVEKK